jgi:hypothetical protein
VWCGRRRRRSLRPALRTVSLWRAASLVAAPAAATAPTAATTASASLAAGFLLALILRLVARLALRLVPRWILRGPLRLLGALRRWTRRPLRLAGALLSLAMLLSGPRLLPFCRHWCRFGSPGSRRLGAPVCRRLDRHLFVEVRLVVGAREI